MDDYIDAGQTVSVPGLVSNLAGDLYVVLADWQPAGSQGATFKVFYNPLIDWLWIGAIILILGSIFAFWPERSDSKLVRREKGAAIVPSASASTLPEKKAPSRSVPAGVVILCLTLLIGFLSVLGWSLFKGKSKPLQLGDTVPDFSITSFTGENISLSKLRGKTVVLNFWASWCVDCANEAGMLEQAWQSVKPGSKVVFIGVDYSDTQSAGAAFLEKYSISYLNGIDPGSQISSIFRVTGVPETYMIGPDGKLLSVKIGPFSSAAEIQTLLGPQE
jgi:peroxiredoxin